MLISKLVLKNWRNFRNLDVPLGQRSVVIGPNAAGKSNLLDVFRFLRTIAQPDGGGLQKAVKERGGVIKLRSLHARKDTEVLIAVEIKEDPEDESPALAYRLGFKSEGRGLQRVMISHESLARNGKNVFDPRPNRDDRTDPVRLTQTYLEQINENSRFRDLKEFLSDITYLHLVPQLLKHADEISGRVLENDPFGQGLLQRIARTSQKTRDARLKRIQRALATAVPQFSELMFEQDPVTGSPHLAARFKHWRENGAKQREDQFSDGTLRLIGLLWALQDGDAPLLLEEPELSLNDAIVEHVPLMIDRVLRERKKGPFTRQVLISTHSDNLLGTFTDPESVVLLESTENGSTARLPDEREREEIAAGLNAAEVMLPKTRPKGVEAMGLI